MNDVYIFTVNPRTDACFLHTFLRDFVCTKNVVFVFLHAKSYIVAGFCQYALKRNHYTGCILVMSEI